jgi:hypothetical protein
MMLMIPEGYATARPGTMPDAKIVAMMMKYNESLREAGVLRALNGLHPPSMGARISFSGGKPKVPDGPFPEAKEVVGGYWIIEVKSKEEAVEWASRCPASGRPIREQRRVGRGATHHTPVRIGEKVRVRTVAPKLGKHNAELFGRFSVAPADLAGLQARGVM